MPLDTSTYSLALLRLDGRRWNELRRIYAQISTQASADGSSYLEMGNTKVICTVTGPEEGRRGASGGGTQNELRIEVDINVAGFAGVERKKRSRGDREISTRNAELGHTLENAFSSICLAHLYPHSSLTLSLHILAQDGGVLAACINAATLALIDAGVPMYDYLVACSSGCTSASAAPQRPSGSIPGLSSSAPTGDAEDPLLDLNGLEEQELPFLTVGTQGATDKVNVLVMETRCHVSRMEEMLAVGLDGCKRVREILDGVVRQHGKRMVAGD